MHRPKTDLITPMKHRQTKVNLTLKMQNKPWVNCSTWFQLPPNGTGSFGVNNNNKSLRLILLHVLTLFMTHNHDAEPYLSTKLYLWIPLGARNENFSKSAALLIVWVVDQSPKSAFYFLQKKKPIPEGLCFIFTAAEVWIFLDPYIHLEMH